MLPTKNAIEATYNEIKDTYGERVYRTALILTKQPGAAAVLKEQALKAAAEVLVTSAHRADIKLILSEVITNEYQDTLK